MDLSSFETKNLMSLFVSNDCRDLNFANDILNQKKADADSLDRLIENLNTTCKEWHFFMENFRIKRIASTKTQCNY